MPYPAKYTPEQKEFVRISWMADKSSQTIADAFTAEFGIPTSRRAIIGLSNRLKLPRRANTGPWRVYSHKEKRPPKSATKPIKPKKPRPNLSTPYPQGPVGDFPEAGLCRWVVADPPDFQCCGHPQHGKGPYCEAHAAIAHDPVRKPMVGTSRVDRSFAF
jgi:hypothetical protein